MSIAARLLFLLMWSSGAIFVPCILRGLARSPHRFAFRAILEA